QIPSAVIARRRGAFTNRFADAAIIFGTKDRGSELGIRADEGRAASGDVDAASVFGKLDNSRLQHVGSCQANRRRDIIGAVTLECVIRLRDESYEIDQQRFVPGSAGV